MSFVLRKNALREETRKRPPSGDSKLNDKYQRKFNNFFGFSLAGWDRQHRQVREEWMLFQWGRNRLVGRLDVPRKWPTRRVIDRVGNHQQRRLSGWAFHMCRLAFECCRDCPMASLDVDKRKVSLGTTKSSEKTHQFRSERSSRVLKSP